MVIKKQHIFIAYADTTFVQSFNQNFIPCFAMDSDTQVDNSGSALSSNMVCDRKEQT